MHDVHNWIELACGAILIVVSGLIKLALDRIRHSLARKDAEQEELTKLRIKFAGEEAARGIISEREAEFRLEREELRDSYIPKKDGDR